MGLSDMTLDLTVAGNLTLDKVFWKGKKTGWVMGGPARYVSLTASLLGLRVSIISNIGYDMPERNLRILEKAGIDVELVRRAPAPTTRFTLKYRDSTREMRLLKKCTNIQVNIGDCRPSRVLHLGPVTDELDPDSSNCLVERAELTSLDPQGFLRRVKKNGVVRLRPWLDGNLLSRVRVLKASREEIRAMTGLSDLARSLAWMNRLGPTIAIATLGPAGVLMRCGGRGLFKIPAYKVPESIHPTGMGDTFIGAFLAQYLKENDPLWAAAVANSTVSLALQRRLKPTYKPILRERANELFERVLRVAG